MSDLQGLPEDAGPDHPPALGAPASAGGGPGASRALLVLLAFFLVQLALGVAVGVAASVYYALVRGGLTPETLAEMQAAVLLPVSLLAVVAGGIVAVAVTFWGARGAALSASRLAVGWRGAPRRQWLAAGGLGLSLSAGYVLLATQFQPPDPHAALGPLTAAANAGGWQRLLWAVLAVFLAPPVEEFVFRGVLWAGLARRLPAALAAALVTATFVLSHVMEARGYWPAWLAITLVAGATLTLRVRSGSLLPPLALHACYNAGLVAVTYLSRA